MCAESNSVTHGLLVMLECEHHEADLAQEMRVKGPTRTMVNGWKIVIISCQHEIDTNFSYIIFAQQFMGAKYSIT